VLVHGDTHAKAALAKVLRTRGGELRVTIG